MEVIPSILSDNLITNFISSLGIEISGKALYSLENQKGRSRYAAC